MIIRLLLQARAAAEPAPGLGLGSRGPTLMNVLPTPDLRVLGSR